MKKTGKSKMKKTNKNKVKKADRSKMKNIDINKMRKIKKDARTNEMARLFILVQNDEHQVIKGAKVEGRIQPKGKFQRIPYDKRLNRYVLDKLKQTPFEIRVKGPKGTSVEHRKVNLKSGDNHIPVMLAKPGMLSFDADGMKYYFTPKKNTLLLTVKGAKDKGLVDKVMKKTGLKYDFIPDSVEKANRDDMLMKVYIGGPKQAKKNKAKLEAIIKKDFPKNGLSGILALPVFKDDELSFGLSNEIIVRFKSGFIKNNIKKMIGQYNLSIERNIPYLGNAFLLKRKTSIDYEILDVLKKLRENDGVVYAQPNILVRLQNFHTPNDYLFQEVPHLQLINCDDAWQTLSNQPGGDIGGSPDITIAVLDLAGVDPLHPDLTGQLSDNTQKMVANFNFVNMSNQTQANLSGAHGTQCAGSATARMDNNIGASGVAPNCHLIGGRMSSTPTLLEIADIWVWMAGFPTGSTHPNFPAQLATGADVISNSWGPTGPMATDPVLRDVFDFLTTFGREGRGSVLCFATGNYGYILLDNFNPLAADPKTLAIGASINTNPTNPCNSSQQDHNGNNNNLPAVVDTRSYYSPFGLTVDIVSPSHTCYDPALPGIGICDPILAPVVSDDGDWPGDVVAQTMLTQAEAQGATVIQVANSAGFQIGEFALFNGPGATPNETRQIIAVAPGQITVTPLENPYPVGTTMVTGPNDYAMNPMVGFGGTSHSCPTVAGAAALILSIRPDLTWRQVRDILRLTATRIDIGQANATGQWVDNDGDGIDEFSQWYGYGRLNVNSAVVLTSYLGLIGDISLPGEFMVVWEDDKDRNGYYQIYARGFNGDGTERFPYFTVNSQASGQQRKPKIAMDTNGGYVVVWEDDKDKNGKYQIYARGFNADGTERFHDMTVNSVASGQQLKPVVATDLNGDFVVIWEDDKDGNGLYQIYARGFNANGTERFHDMTVNSEASGQQLKPAVAMGPYGDFIVVWQDDKDKNGKYQIYARGFNADGTERFHDMTVNSVAAGQQLKPAIAMGLNGEFVVTWEDDKDGNRIYQIYARGFNADGTERFHDMTVNSVASGQQLKPKIDMAWSGAFVVAWQDDKDKNGKYQIYARGFNANGTERFHDMAVNSVAAGQQLKPAIAMAPYGDFVITWEDDQNKNGLYEILARGFSLDGHERFRDIVVNSVGYGQQRKPDIAIKGA